MYKQESTEGIGVAISEGHWDTGYGLSCVLYAIHQIAVVWK